MLEWNPSEIKIYKVKLWAMYFKYENEYYLLHYGGDLYDEVTTLYHKILDENGKYKLEHISSKYGNHIPSCVYETTTYSHINRCDFVLSLLKQGFIDSVKLSL